MTFSYYISKTHGEWAIEKSIEINPNEIMSYWVLGEIYEEKGMSKVAQNYKYKAVAVSEALTRERKTNPPKR